MIIYILNINIRTSIFLKFRENCKKENGLKDTEAVDDTKKHFFLDTTE